MVVRHGVEAGDDGSVLVIGIKDAAVEPTTARRSAVFRKMTDECDRRGAPRGGQRRGRHHRRARSWTHGRWCTSPSTPWTSSSCGPAPLSPVVVEDGKVLPEDGGQERAQALLRLWHQRDLRRRDRGRRRAPVPSRESVAWDPKEQKPTAASKAKSVRATQGTSTGAARRRGRQRHLHALPPGPRRRGGAPGLGRRPHGEEPHGAAPRADRGAGLRRHRAPRRDGGRGDQRRASTARRW